MLQLQVLAPLISKKEQSRKKKGGGGGGGGNLSIPRLELRVDSTTTSGLLSLVSGL